MTEPHKWEQDPTTDIGGICVCGQPYGVVEHCPNPWRDLLTLALSALHDLLLNEVDRSDPTDEQARCLWCRRKVWDWADLGSDAEPHDETCPWPPIRSAMGW